jgi:MFS family permease
MAAPSLGCANPATPGSARRKGTLQYTAAGLALLFFYLLWGDFVMQLMEMVIPKVLPLQLKQMGASNKTIGFLIKSLPFIFNMSINPVVSVHSDNFRSAWGRRRPYLLAMTPLVTLALVMLGFAPEITRFLQGTGIFRGVNPRTALIVTIAVLLALYQIFHYLMSPMYYYLFVDVVPDKYMGRFLALFRVVAGLKAFVFSTFIYGYSLTHTKSIYVGCALIYCVGFMWMALMVKEGDYPPPMHKKLQNPWSLIRLYCRECYSHPHYLLFNLRNATYILAGAADVYAVFVARDELGMSLSFIGRVAGWTSLIAVALYYPFGMLCDKYNPVRVVLLAMVLHAPLALLSFIYLHGPTSYIVLMLIALPINALIGAAEMPFYAMIPPRDRYGQFGAANQVIIGITAIAGGFLAGWYMDRMTANSTVVANYRYLYLWSFACQLLSLVAMFLLYRSWLRHGGADHYVPPAVGRKSPAVESGQVEPAVAEPPEPAPLTV